jgi:hypothetical protein
MRSFGVVYARTHPAPGERRRARVFRAVQRESVNMARRNDGFAA